MGNIVLAASSAKPDSFNPTDLILILVVVVGFYMLMIRPQKRRQQQAQQRQNSAQPGARVRTTAGMYATIVAVDGDDVILEVAPGIEVRYMKRAIMDVVSPGEEPEDTGEEPEDTEDSYDGEETDDSYDGEGEGEDEESAEDAEDAEDEAEPEDVTASAQEPAESGSTAKD
jgi:preprotein translocase subunit YajC